MLIDNEDYSWYFRGYIEVLHLGDSKTHCRVVLVAQWLRVRLPMQGTRVRGPVWEDPTCRRAAGPLSLRVRSLCSATGEATAVRDPRTAKKKKKKLYFDTPYLWWHETFDDIETLPLKPGSSVLPLASVP